MIAIPAVYRVVCWARYWFAARDARSSLPASSKSKPTSVPAISLPTPPPVALPVTMCSSAPPGRAYVYFIYGMHYCLNVSCLPDGIAGGVLFRAVEPLAGIEHMAEARGLDLATLRDFRLLTTGPGRMAEAFGITRERDNGKDITSPTSDLWIADNGYRVKRVLITKRIGITKSADMPLRYIIDGNRFVSR